MTKKFADPCPMVIAVSIIFLFNNMVIPANERPYEQSIEKKHNDQDEISQPNGSEDYLGDSVNHSRFNVAATSQQEYEQEANRIAKEYRVCLDKFQLSIEEAINRSPNAAKRTRRSDNDFFRLDERITKYNLFCLFNAFKRELGGSAGHESTQYLNMIYVLIYSRHFILLLNKCSFNDEDLINRTTSLILRAYNICRLKKIPIQVIDIPLKNLYEYIILLVKKHYKKILDSADLFPFLFRALSPNGFSFDLISFRGQCSKFGFQIELTHDCYIILPYFTDIINLGNRKGEIDSSKISGVTSTPLFFSMYKGEEECWPGIYDSICIREIWYKILAIYIFCDSYLESFYPDDLEDPFTGQWFTFYKTYKLKWTIVDLNLLLQNNEIYVIYEKTKEKREPPAARND